MSSHIRVRHFERGEVRQPEGDRGAELPLRGAPSAVPRVRPNGHTGGVEGVAPRQGGEMERMQESYDKGVANHVGPELCVASRKAGCEALVGARAGRVLSPESTHVGSADAVPSCGRQHRGRRYARRSGTPRGRRPRACTEPSRAQLGRSQVPPSARSRTGRSGKAEAARR